MRHRYMQAVERARYAQEAFAIADGGTMTPPQREHVQALIDVIAEQRDQIEGRYVAEEQANLERDRREEEGADARTLREEIDDTEAAQAYEEQRKEPADDGGTGYPDNREMKDYAE